MSWKNVDIPESEGSSDFYKLKEGDNKLRIVSSPVQRLSHFDTAAKKSYPHTHGGCVHCTTLGKPRVRYVFYVIDLQDKVQKLLEVGTQVVKQIKQYANSEDYAFDSEVMPYYVNIQRKGSGLETEYTVIPARVNTDLTEEEKKMVADRKPLEEVVNALEGKKEKPKSDWSGNDEDIRVEDIPF